MTQLLHRWTEKHRAQHEAKKRIVAAALACLADYEFEGAYPLDPKSSYGRLLQAVRDLKKART